MKIIHKYPPNYKKIVKKFPFIKGKQGIIFTYGNTLYVPSGSKIPDHLMKHEKTHAKQQENHSAGIKGWWSDYIKNKEFRLEQELEAYQNQYGYAKEYMNRQQRRHLLKEISKDLSSPLYGNIISKKRAKQLIKQKGEIK